MVKVEGLNMLASAACVLEDGRKRDDNEVIKIRHLIEEAVKEEKTSGSLAYQS